MDITEIQDELLRLEYPNLLPDHDPDIERYYYLRSMGQPRDAMVIYQNRLRPRYPDDEFRTWLLRSYRSHDPAFRSLLSKGYRMLGARSLERVKQIILLIAEQADSYNEKDVYSTIKTAEEILKFLPKERYEAVAGMERFLRYASALGLKLNSIARAAELVRAYLTDTLSVVEEERRRRADVQRLAKETERQQLVQADWDGYYYQKKYGIRAPMIDLSSVVFSPADLARIEIPPFSRIEDQILGYCVKYWNVVDDPAFERILFLYSRKYGTKNYDVYMSIRRGREAKHRDDEILASIMSILVTGYYYSIQGDLYLQRNWNAIKRGLANQQKALPAPAAEVKQIEAKPKQIEAKPEQKAGRKRRHIEAKPAAKKAEQPRPEQKRTPKKTESSKRARPTQAPARPGPAIPKAPPKIAPRPKSKTAPKIAPKSAVIKRPAAVAARPAQALRPAGAVVPVKPVKVPYKLKPAQETKTTIVAKTASLPRPVPAAPARSVPPPVKPIRPAVPVRPAAPIWTVPVQVQPVVPPRPAVPAKPTQAAPRPAASKPPIPAVPIQAKPAPASVPRPAVPAKPPASAPVQKSIFAPYTPVSPRPRPKQKVFTNKTLGKAKGSVSDRLRELSGRSYDVYQDRFLGKARNAIRKVLGTGKGLFFSLPEEAEDLVYNFLRDHYSNPYMDWEDSADRRNLLSMGFDLPSINPVIDECYRTL